MNSGLFNRRDLIAYFLVAATGALIQLLIGSVSQNWFPITYGEALTFGYLAASVVGFFLTKLFAFTTRNATKSRREMVKFGLVTVVSFIITVPGSERLFDLSVGLIGIHTVMIPFSVKTVELNKLVCHLICMTISFISNYVLHKRFTIQETGFYERLKKLLYS